MASLLTRARVQHLLIVLVGTAVAIVVTRDVPYILNRSFWLDESWVALTVRYPLADLPHLTSSTPIGWNATQRLFEPLGEQAQRLLPLIFAWLASAVAYVLGYFAWDATRRIRILTGIFVSAVVICSPFMLARTDLKQYTADVFFALLVATLAVLAERRRSRAALYTLTIVSSLGMFFSLTVVFVAASAFLALLGAAIIRRDKRLILERAVAGAISAASILLVYFSLYRQASVGALADYWADYYPSLSALPTYLVSRSLALTGVSSVPLQVLILVTVAALIISFVVLAFREREFVMGIYLIALVLAVLAAGVARVYPLLNVRTSSFFLVSMCVFAALALARLGVLASYRFVGEKRRGIALVAAFALLIAGAVAFSARDFRSNVISLEDPRSQIDYIKTHWSKNDIIATDDAGAFSLAYYWPELGGRWVASDKFANGFHMTFARSSGVVVAGKGDDLPSLLESAITSRHATTVWFLSTHHLQAPYVSSTNVVDEFGARRISTGTEPLYAVRAATLG
ncbi:MAG: hypothetical protein EPN91_12715 [Salinibacterium sp.]|nr:MAG: hypothetical protein EPN91_12715 [Salinibacterium sp.]